LKELKRKTERIWEKFDYNYENYLLYGTYNRTTCSQFHSGKNIFDKYYYVEYPSMIKCFHWIFIDSDFRQYFESRYTKKELKSPNITYHFIINDELYH
jgi:hypothetical protein